MHGVIYRFDHCVLDTDRVLLARDGVELHVEPQVFAVLEMLIERRGSVVRKEELLDGIWGTRFVSESALTSRIRSARQAVGDDGTTQQVIRTVHGRGYEFVAPGAWARRRSASSWPAGWSTASPTAPTPWSW